MKFKSSLAFFGAIVCVLVLNASPVQAQATRTWISGVGDDVNPCSRTAPCKTFAGAISKTAAGGEINCLDPGGFGGVTITKAMTLDCSGTFGSILVAGTNGITVNTANTTDKVVLRGLEIQGAGSGLAGIRILKAGQVSIDKVTILGFTGNGVDIVNIANAADVYVTDSYITNVATGINATATVANLGVGVNNTTIANTATNGFAAASNFVVATISNTLISSAGSNAVVASAGGAQVNVTTSQLVNNNTALNAAGGATVRVSSSDIYNNGNNFVIAAGGTIASDGKNRITTGAGSPNGTVANQ